MKTCFTVNFEYTKFVNQACLDDSEQVTQRCIQDLNNHL